MPSTACFTTLALLLAAAPLNAAPTPDAPQPTHYNHAAMIVVDVAFPSHMRYDPDAAGGMDDPATENLNFYSVPPANQALDYCKQVKANPTQQVPSQFVAQVQIPNVGPSGPGTGANSKPSDFIIDKPFEGYEMGKNCTYDGTAGPFGTLKCAGSMTLSSGSAPCLAPTNSMRANTNYCSTGDGGYDNYTPLAYCPW